MNSDFEPYKAFCHLDTRRVGRVDAHDIVDFLRKHYVSLDLSEAQDIVREYNASANGALSFNDFCQFVLPATSNSLRSVAENRRFSPYFRPTDPLSYSVVNLLVRLVEKELGLQRRRNQTKRQL